MRRWMREELIECQVFQLKIALRKWFLASSLRRGARAKRGRGGQGLRHFCIPDLPDRASLGHPSSGRRGKTAHLNNSADLPHVVPQSRIRVANKELRVAPFLIEFLRRLRI